MIKLMNYGALKRIAKPEFFFISKDNIGGMCQCEEEDGIYTCIWTKEERPASYLVKETPEEIIAMPDIEECDKFIDWEQRRYEIAKEMLPTIYSMNQSKNMTPQQMASIALIHADELIKELVKK